MVIRGSGRIKLDDEIVEIKEWDAVRVPPGTSRGYRPVGRPRDPSNRLRVGTLRGTTSKVSETGWPTCARRGARPRASSSPSRAERRRTAQCIGLDAATERRQRRPETAEGKRYARSDAARKLGIDEDELGTDAWKIVDASADSAGRRRHTSTVGR